ncbi:NADH dehydrogenase [ubiquinone] 1 alpha subcomplex subunit 12-like [Argonauta hians]
MAKYLQKFSTFFRIIKENGGWKESYMTLYRTDDLKTGKLVGEDEFGNKYYQNQKYFFGRSRWVVYNKKFNVDYDGSMIPSAWHRWLHYIGDSPPTTEPPFSKDWMLPHTENPSGTCKEYVPYSTTRPKISSWEPPK